MGAPRGRKVRLCKKSICGVALHPSSFRRTVCTHPFRGGDGRTPQDLRALYMNFLPSRLKIK
jgi:hypothetical protein